ADNGTRVRISGKGAPGVAGGPSGDLFLVIDVTPHALFKRQGQDLEVTVNVDLYTAVLGGEVQVPLPNNKKILLTIPPQTQNNTRFRLRGKGMPILSSPSSRGDLYAVVEVAVPENLNQEEMALFHTLQDMRNKNR
ncbi:MAG: DnaJ C-terminal domain-containing protein, partial [Anaerolineae bacterium]|nr:DnaJ C-terminal domain-containing protein [Anaerolineae bacterium]